VWYWLLLLSVFITHSQQNPVLLSGQVIKQSATPAVCSPQIPSGCIEQGFVELWEYLIPTKCDSSFENLGASFSTK
jgi:hypothetical protein